MSLTEHFYCDCRKDHHNEIENAQSAICCNTNTNSNRNCKYKVVNTNSYRDIGLKILQVQPHYDNNIKIKIIIL